MRKYLVAMESTPFFIFLFIHLGGLILGFGAVIVTDLYGLLWVWNRVRFPQLVSVSGKTETFIWAGWGTMVLAGIPLILMKGVVDNLMMIKLFLVAVIGLNGLLLHQLHKRIVGYREGEDVPKLTMFRLIFGLTLSQIAWWGAFTIGFLHRHVQSIINVPEQPLLYCGIFLAILAAIWFGGEAVLKRSGLVNV